MDWTITFLLLWLVLAIWDSTWKALGLWKSAKKGHLVWFVFIFIINSLGILPILYIFIFSERNKKRPETEKKVLAKKKVTKKVVKKS